MAKLKNKKNLIVLAVIAIILLATLSVSVAIFSSVQNGKKLVSVTTGDLKFKYTEVTGVGNGINIEDAEPVSDNDGKALSNYFDFKIEANLVGSDMYYEVSVEPLSTSNIPLSAVKFYLTEFKNNSEVELNGNINGQNKVKTLSEYNDLVVYRERILKNTHNYEKDFRVRIWLSEDADPDTYMNTQGSYKINVNARSDVSMINASVPVPEITGGTGSTWISGNGEITLSSTRVVVDGIKEYEYYITTDEEDVPDDLTVPTGTTSNSVSVVGNGINYVYYRTVLMNNEKSAWSSPQVVKKDSLVPTNLVIAATDNKASEAWHGADFILNFSATKNGPTDVVYYYGVTETPDTLGNSVLVNTVSSTTVGTTYYVKACNGAGVCSANTSYVAKLDKTQPTVPGISGGTAAWTSTAPTVSVTTASTALSDIKEYEYYIYTTALGVTGAGVAGVPTSETTATGTGNSILIDTNGTSYVYFRAVSNADLKSDWSIPETVYCDGTTYTITYNLNSGTNPANAITSYKVDTETFNLPTPTRTGYTFGGWYESSNFSGSQVTQITKGSRENKTYYAKWTANNYTVTYVGNEVVETGLENRVLELDSTSTAVPVVNSNALSLSTNVDYIVSFDYKELTGINQFDVDLYPDDLPQIYPYATTTQQHQDWVLTSSSTGMSSCYLRFFDDCDPGGDNGITTISNVLLSKSISNQVTYGEIVPTITKPTRTGYTFGGYYSEPNGNGNRYYDENGNALKNYDIADDSKLYAKWTINKYKVKFNANGGTGTMNDQNFTYGTAQNLTANTFERSGYTFAGWAKSANAVEVNYVNSQSVNNLTATNNEIVNLYAIWVKTTHNFGYNGTNGTDGSVQTFKAPVTGYYKLEVWGAQGGSTNSTYIGGYGGYSVGVAKLTGNTTYYVTVGGQGQNGTATVSQNYGGGGYNGGGSRAGWTCSTCTYYSSGGGGATHIATANGVLSSLSSSSNRAKVLIVAGGGGGNGYVSDGWNINTTAIGSGGGFQGNKGNPDNEHNSASVATQTSGAAFGQGQNCGSQGVCDGGGAGWYGGYIGTDGASGGSGYIGNSLLLTRNGITKQMYCYNCTPNSDSSTKTTSTTNVSGTATANYAKSGHGYAKITWIRAN